MKKSYVTTVTNPAPKQAKTNDLSCSAKNKYAGHFLHAAAWVVCKFKLQGGLESLREFFLQPNYVTNDVR